jgi:hypothetical protein
MSVCLSFSLSVCLYSVPRLWVPILLISVYVSLSFLCVFVYVAVGHHSREILTEILHMPETEIESLFKRGVVRTENVHHSAN